MKGGRTLAWFKVDDGLHASRKFLSIPRRGRFAAIGVWTVAGSWSADQLTNGHVPEYMLEEWNVPPSAAESLVSAGLWEVEQGGYVFRNWLEYQPSKQDVDAERAASRERMRELRARRKQPKPQKDAEEAEMFGRTVTNGSENVRNPDPTRPDPTRARLHALRPNFHYLPLSSFHPNNRIASSIGPTYVLPQGRTPVCFPVLDFPSKDCHGLEHHILVGCAFTSLFE